MKSEQNKTVKKHEPIQKTLETFFVTIPVVLLVFPFSPGFYS